MEDFNGEQTKEALVGRRRNFFWKGTGISQRERKYRVNPYGKFSQWEHGGVGRLKIADANGPELEGANS